MYNQPGYANPQLVLQVPQGPAGGQNNFLLSPQAQQLSLDKVPSASSYQYKSKKAKKQAWLAQFKSNKILNTDLQLKGYDRQRASNAFLITLKGTFGIPFSSVISETTPLAGTKFFLEYYMTLFNKNVGTGIFYGRTYSGNKIELKEASGTTWDTTNEQCVYFHTSYTDKSSIAVIECVIVREFAGSKIYSSAGYALCPIFEFSGLTTVDLIKGSPRVIGQIGLSAVGNSLKSSGKLQFEIRDFDKINPLKKIIPQNCFFAPGDIVPGLVGDAVPNPRVGNGDLGKGLNVELCQTQVLYLHNIQLITSPAFEQRLESYLKRVKLERTRTARMGVNNNVSDSVIIHERHVKVCAHNSWMTLGEEQPTKLSLPDSARPDIIAANSYIKISNYICHPLVALIFRVEYKVLMPEEKESKELFLNIGWTYHVPTLNTMSKLQNEQLEYELELGPGKVPTGDLLWDPSNDDMNHYEIKLRAFLSVDPIAPTDTYNPQAQVRGQYQDPYQAPANSAFAGMQAPFRPNQNIPNQFPPQRGQGQQPNINLGANQQYGGQKGVPNQNYGYNAYEDEIMKQKNKHIQDLQDKERHTQQLLKQQEQMLQELEMNKLAMKNRNFDPNQQANQELMQQIRILEEQKKHYQQDMMAIHAKLDDYKNSLKDLVQFNNQQPYGNSMGYSNPGNYADQFHQMQGISYDQNSAKQIAMIGNVFYNMLNLIGENERDKRIIGLGENLKKMIQQKRFDDLLAPKAPYVGMGMINLLKTTDLAISDQISIIKLGQGDLLQHPSAQILSGSIQQEMLSLQKEFSDPLQASQLTFKFLCYKAPSTPQEYLPSKLFFQLKFFTFPSIQTDKVKIVADLNPDGHYKFGQVFYLSKEHPGVNRALTTNQLQQTQKQPNMIDTRMDPNLLQIIYDIDPSVSKIKDQHQKLAVYLKERFLTVDIFDGDTLFLYGVCKIPLYELLRQGMQAVVRAKECEMCDPDTGEFRGAIQLIMSNTGKYCSTTEEQPIPKVKNGELMTDTINQRSMSPQKSRLQPSQNDASGKQSKYKKVVRSKPMDLTRMQQTNNDVNMLTGVGGQGTMNNFNQSILSQMNPSTVSNATFNADLRKKLRVDRVRKMTVGLKEASATYTSVEDPSQPDWAKIKSLKEIEVIRETKKLQVLNRVIDEYCSTSDQMAVTAGQLEFFTTKVSNPYKSNEVYTVHINDPDERHLSAPEMTLVTQRAELNLWKNKLTMQVDYDAIQSTGDIYLRPNQEVELLFKFMTTREVSVDPHKDSSADCIKARKIQIIINQANGKEEFSIELNVVPQSAIIDHTFRFYEPENSHVTLTIPPFLELNHPGLFAVISRPNVAVEIQRDSNSFKIETRTLEAPDLREMTLFVYGDQFKEKLLACCAIEVYSMKTIYSQIKAGVQTTQSLQLPAENARQVQIHSNNPRLVYLPRKTLNQTFKLIPQTLNNISICAKAFQATRQKVRVNCTDINSGHLVYQWLMIIDADQPTVTKVQQISIQNNYFSSQVLPFVNRLNQEATFEFASSRPDLVRPNQDRVNFKTRESKNIIIDFAPQSQYGSIQAYLFANDLDYNIVECYDLQITYYPSNY